MDITEELFNHLKYNVKTEIRPSSVHGVGVFAIKNIKKGEELFIPWNFKTGHYIIPFDKFNSLPANVINLINKYFGIESEKGKEIFIINSTNLNTNNIMYCNSSYPNNQKTNSSGKGVALKDIFKDEEILIDYNPFLKLKKEGESIL